MKLFALFVALAGCSAPLPEVDEIQHKLITRYSPFLPTHRVYVYFGSLAFSSQAGILWMDVSGAFPGPCIWESVSNADGLIDQDVKVYGSNANDTMQIAQGSFTVQCSGGSSYWMLPYNPTSIGIKITLNGLSGHDLLHCADSGQPGWGRAECQGDYGNDTIFLWGKANTGRGGPGDDTIVKGDGSPHQAAAYGDDGADCITWIGGTQGGVADCGSGADKVKGLLGSVNCETVNGCGY